MVLKKKADALPPGRHHVRNVFTPTRPAAPLNYVARPSLDDRLVDVLRTPGKQLIVYGESGSGKSTLLRNKLQEVYEAHIKTQCSAAMSYDQVLLDAFDQLNSYYVRKITAGSSRSISPSVGADIKAIKISVDAKLATSKGTEQERILPPQLTAQRLAAFMGELGMCWLIEDFHKILEPEKTLFAQTLKIFSDMTDDYPEVKIITIGATETAREVVKYDPDMTKRVSEFLVPLMTPAELGQILTKGEELLNISMVAIRNDIVDYSVGMPSVCHQIALNACFTKGIEATQRTMAPITRDDLASAVRRSVDELSDTIRQQFEAVNPQRTRARFDNTRLILSALAEGPVSGLPLDDVLAEIRKREPGYPKSNMNKYLKEMSRPGRLLRLGPDGRVRFAEPVYHTVAKATLIDLASGASGWSFKYDSYLEQVVAGTVIGNIYNAPKNWNFLGPLPASADLSALKEADPSLFESITKNPAEE